MKIAYVVVGTTIVQLAISEPLYADAVAEMTIDATDFQSIQGLLSALCSYVLATIDFEETASDRSRYILNRMDEVGIRAAVAALWRYNEATGHTDAPVLDVPLLDEHKQAIRNANGLVKHFAFGHFTTMIEPHAKIWFGMPASAIN